VSGENAENVQAALYRIAELASAAQDMQEFYRAIHEIVGELMPARNFFIALYDGERQRINWPYYIDEAHSDDSPDPNQWFAVETSRSATGYVLGTGEPQHLSADRITELIERQEIDLIGPLAEDWLGVPLKDDGRTVGVLVVQSYTKGTGYTEHDEELLGFVGQHIGSALARARAIEETRQRNAELAVINSVQAALAGELEMQAIYDVVGDKIQEIFDAQGVAISFLDEAAGLVSFPYLIERGERFRPEPVPYTRGFTKHVLETREPLMINEDMAAEAERYRTYVVAGEMPKSMLWVPLLTGARANGVISLDNFDREHAFDDADLRLLTTLASSLSVALENARLVHETRQRNAELALINSVQTALAGELEMQAIYEIVGDKIQEIFDAQGTTIAILDETTGFASYPYMLERGERLSVEPRLLESGFTKHVIDTREPVMINEDVAAEAERFGSFVLAGEAPNSLLFVPLVSGGRGTGAISLENFDREHAFDEADQRLLTTLASSLSVALENARLVHETRQRNAELGLINSVQDALAGELEMQAIYDAVGDRIRDVFDAQLVDIAIYDESDGLVHFPYGVERGKRLADSPMPLVGFRQVLLEAQEPLLITENMEAEAEKLGMETVGSAPKSGLFVPLVAGGAGRGWIALQNADREHAFSESDQQLLETLASSLGVALENARLVHETRQRNAELALINSVQAALAGELEMQAIYDVVGDKIQEIFDAQVVDIGIYDFAAGLTRYPYTIERGVRFPEDVAPIDLTHPTARQLLHTKSAVLIADVAARDRELGRTSPVAEGTERPQSMLFAPLVSGDEVRGRISLQNLDRTNAFTDSDVRLLTTLASSLSVALENARLVHETRQRNAELALINSVQDAIAGELDQQAIYDAVGDRIQEIFDAQVASIMTFDEATGLLHYPYIFERGKRLQAEPNEVGGFAKVVLETRKPLLLGENVLSEAERLGSFVLAGETAKSVLFVPLVTGGQAAGVISLQNVDREHAFSDSDEQLLETLAGSLSVALENARLVHETRQRNAELALINDVQDALAGELEMQAIYGAVGDRIGEIFDVQSVSIAITDESTGNLEFPYAIELGTRHDYEIAAMAPYGFRKHVLETGESLRFNQDVEAEAERFGNPVIIGEMPKSVLFVPLASGGRTTGVIDLQNINREQAFSDSDQQLLETLAGSLSVALENARLVHETRQRNAELALINSVQEAWAGELEMQAIYDVVGDKIQEIFDAQVVDIATFDFAAGLTHFPYIVEKGVRFAYEPVSIEGSRITRRILEAKAPVLINDIPAWEEEEGVAQTVLAGEPALSVLVAPLTAGDEIRGRISLQNIDRTNAFTENDVRLLTTLAGSLSVALENARLVHETRQRNAELALINSVQDAIAGELDQQAIYDAVGDKIQEIFDAQVVQILRLDETTGLAHYPYVIERGERLHVEPVEPLGFSKHVLTTREPLLLTENLGVESERYGSYTIAGDAPKSVLFVPLVSAGRATGVISLQNGDREHAFGESDQQLLETLAGSLSVALENARLVHETRQRNAELALINSVQDAIAGELDQQAIYDAVGDRIQEIFDAQVVAIITLDEASGLMQFPYTIERGERLQAEPGPPAGFSKHVVETRESLLIAENAAAESERYGSRADVGEVPKSVLFVPLVTGGKATGAISLQNVDREHAFGESDQQLLETLAGSLSVALENARLVHETRQRNAELALINSVQDAIAGELDQQAIYDAVGDRIQEIFEAEAVFISIVDEATQSLHIPYLTEFGVRQWPEPSPLASSGFTPHIIQTREPLMINENLDAEAERYGSHQLGSRMPKAILYVPLVAGGRATGVVSLASFHEHAFDDGDLQLLETLAGSLSVALENARLVDETRQRNAELALINGVQEAIAGELDAQAIYDAVGDRIRDVFDAQVVSIATVDEAAGVIQYPYLIERGERLQAEPRPLAGFAKHVLETRQPLLIAEDVEAESARYGSTIVAGELPRSVLFIPLVAGGTGVGVISLQNIDREHAFGEDDQRLLTTLAGSLTVALENARLVAETRQRVAELATVNSVGQALSSQLDLDALIELVGEHVRETFAADLAYVALHDETSRRIEFAYYYESGERRQEPPMEYGEGITSQILASREPLLLNRREQLEGQEETIGTPALSYLGVPIVVGAKAIGVISVQSIHEEGRFVESDSRLLSTIAANVGVAIQNARLFTEVERQREYLASLVEISPAAVVVMTADERVTEWNPAAAELFGYSAEEAVGRPIDELVFGSSSFDTDEGREITREALATGRAQRITRRRRRDGTMVDVELMFVPLTVDGSHVGFLAMYHDVTELQRARHEAEAATQAKSAFLATMSHEIRTPMNAVIGMTDLLLGTELTGEQREFAEVVHSSGDALLHVIDDILDYSKIEAGKLDLEREPFNLRDCVEGALDIVAPRAWEKELELGCLIDDNAPAGIVGDEARLRQVLLNLLSNAVKFTERGEVVVLVDAEATKAGTYVVELAVRDTGIGIPADRMDVLFTSFSQVDASTTRRFGGTGLGLAISKRLVELMGGEISVESEQKKGSTFRISLPATAADVPTRFALDEGLPLLAGKRILVVDDNATNREIVTRHARAWEMEPVSVEFPAAALELISNGEPFDIAVLDMMMPEMDGITLAREIRRHRSEEELPLLLLTSLGRLSQAQTEGVFSAQLSKPLKASQLYNTLLQLLTAGRAGEEEVETVTDGKRTRSALRILLAEDNAMNQKVALRLLEQLGYGADVANNGLEAIEALERQPYDVVLMDVQMPELDGLDATRQICERWPEETRPHIVAMTANALPEDREACFAAGMNDYVAKPIRAEELVAALKRVRPLPDADGAATGVAYVSLDDGALANLRGLGGDEFLGEVIDAFLADAPELIATLRGSLEEQRSEELRRAAHTLKSNGATLGAEQFAELCRTLEQRAKDGELDDASKLVDRIEEQYRLLEEALAALRSESPA
jgi:PAS domain S-box-containing protein